MTVLTRRIPVLPADVPGAGALGRHVRHDSRSRAFAHQPSSRTLKTTTHERRIPVLDQGSLGECTAASSVGALGTEPFFTSLSDLGQLTFDDPMCRDLYHQFTAEDSYEGTWPPDDTGSDGLTAAKVLKERGLISGYTHTFTTNDALLAVGPSDGTGVPVITGVNWYSSMDAPSSSGEVKVTSQAFVRGGHEIEVAGIDVEEKRVWLWQSWGLSFGLSGRFWWSFDTWDRLLHEQGDVTVFVPRTSAPPVPTPTHDPADVALAAWFRRNNWVTKRHVGDNGAVQRAAAQWLKTKGL